MRPIPRRSYLQDAVASEAHNTGNQSIPSSTNAAIGVVIPTTPNSTLHQQQNQLNEQLLHHNQQLLSMRVPDGAPQQPRNPTATFNNNNNHNNSNSSIANSTNNINNDKSLHMEERISQIQDYIRITTSLIDSINVEKVRDLYSIFFFSFSILVILLIHFTQLIHIISTAFCAFVV